MGCRTAVRRKAESAARLASMPTALELLDLVFDAGTWSSWDTPAADPPGIDPAYARALAAARARTGLDESVLTRLVAVSAAVGRHVAAGLPYLVYLRHPTTGGVFASWGSLGQLSIAEPGALIGYHGPRVSAALTGAEFPAGVQVAENLCAHGLVDAVVPPHGVGAMARRALDVMCAGTPDEVPPPGQAALPDVPAWEVVERSRRPNRPGVVALLTAAASQVTTLADPGPGLVLALARFGTAPCVLVGQDRRGPAIDPDGLRAARRGLRLAAELRLPLVSVIDSGGAELSQRAEEGGLAGEIARNVADLVALPTPTVCLLLGQGAGGAALAYLPADRAVARPLSDERCPGDRHGPPWLSGGDRRPVGTVRTGMTRRGSSDPAAECAA